MHSRLGKIRRKLTEEGIDALLISQADNRRYLSGFTGSAGFLIISQQQAVLATDFRYVEQAKQQSPHFDVIQTQGGIAEWLPEIVLRMKLADMGLEANDLPFTTYRHLTEAASRVEGGFHLIPTEGLVESVRSVKEETELELITRAVELADSAFEQAASLIHPGMTEKEAAWQIERFLRENGSESIPFEIIVASGPRSALPHAKPTERPFLADEPIIIDLGARVEGYCSDLSRTICLGPGNNTTFTGIYQIVLKAQLTAIEGIQLGMPARQADNLARAVIAQSGYGRAFGHSLGHGVGLAPHESPSLSPTSQDILTDGMVFTIEPAIYLKDWGGVRIEDTVVMENGRVRILSKANKMVNKEQA